MHPIKRSDTPSCLTSHPDIGSRILIQLTLNSISICGVAFPEAMLMPDFGTNRQPRLAARRGSAVCREILTLSYATL
jgi:hypothetical protein